MTKNFTLQTGAVRPAARLAVLLAAGFAGVWALMEAMVGQLHGSYHVIQIECCRFAAHLLLMLAIWGRRDGANLWRTTRPALQVGRAALMLCIPLGFGVALSQGVTVATALAGLWLAPVMALGAASWWLRERSPATLWILAALGLAGAFAILGPSRPASLSAWVMPILMGLSLALYLAATRILRHEPVRANLFLMALGGFMLLLPLMPMVWVKPSLHDALWFGAIGLIGFFALWLLEQSLRRWSLSNVAPVLYVHLAFLALVMSLSSGRLPALRVLIGVGLVGLVMAFMWSRARARDDDSVDTSFGPLSMPASCAVPLERTP